jgi:hypothetical protein
VKDTELWLSGVLMGVPECPALALASREERSSCNVCAPVLRYGGL